MNDRPFFGLVVVFFDFFVSKLLFVHLFATTIIAHIKSYEYRLNALGKV